MPDASQEKLSSKSEPPINSLLRPARRVLFIVGAIVGIIELVQHFILNDFEINLYLIGEVAIYFLALPAVGWILSGYLERSEKMGVQSVQTLQQQTELNRMLGSASEWNEVVQASVEFPHFVLPMKRAQLFLDINNDGLLEAAGAGQSKAVTATNRHRTFTDTLAVLAATLGSPPFTAPIRSTQPCECRRAGKSTACRWLSAGDHWALFSSMWQAMSRPLFPRFRRSTTSGGN